MEIQKYFRKSYDVNVVQVTPENANEIAEWCGGTVVEGDYQHSKFTIKLPIVQVPGNGPNKDKMISARIGTYVVEYNRLFRVYREKQLLEDFVKYVENAPYFKPGDLVQETEEGSDWQGEVQYVDQVLVSYPVRGNVLHERKELQHIGEYSTETKNRFALQEEARKDPGLEKINELRAEAERLVMQGDLNIHEALTEAFEEQQIIENIGDFKIGTDVVISDQMNDFFSQVGTVESFVNDNCIAVKMEMLSGQKEAQIVNHLVREVQICDQVKWVEINSETSAQNGWVGWVVQDAPIGEAVTVAFRPVNFMDGTRDRCFSYMSHELEELGGQPEKIPTYEI